MNITELPSVVKDSVESPIECCEATSIEDQVGRLEVLTERYQNEGYLAGVDTIEIDDITIDQLLSKEGLNILQSRLNAEERKNFAENGVLIGLDGMSLYLDKYNWNSIPFVVKQGENYLGSARLIVKNGDGLPTLNDPRIEISDSWRPIISGCNEEFSQFAIRKGAPIETSQMLLKAAYDYSKKIGIKGWLATTDNRVVRLLNSNFFRFDLPNIGPSVDYLGSLSTPVYIDLERALNNAETYESSRKIANYIRGK